MWVDTSPEFGPLMQPRQLESECMDSDFSAPFEVVLDMTTVLLSQVECPGVGEWQVKPCDASDEHVGCC